MALDVGAPPADVRVAARALERRPGLVALFALTSFMGASLLFMVQPMVARMLLPHFGGSASVWSTSNLFFQGLLLVGYLYVHLTTQRIGRRTQPLLHVGVLLTPLLVLPLTLPVMQGTETSPVARLLVALLVMVGLPFAVISTTGPLLQRWYSWTGLQRSDDPYFLFATSNLGSFGGLLAYPFLVEPFVTLDDQRLWWSWGFGGFLVLMAACGLVARGTKRSGVPVLEAGAEASRTVSVSAPSTRTLLHWLFLAFLPSTLMLSVTSHISTDIAAIPLMWVVPLAIYLATFIVAFARVDRDPGRLPFLVAVAAAGVGTLFLLGGTGVPLIGKLALDLVLLGAGAYAAHARLAALRPHPEYLTRFYLVVAAGGALGGLLNGVVAPIYFDRVWEYPLGLVGVALLGVGVFTPRDRGRYHPVFVLVLTGLALTLALLLLGLVGVPWAADRGPVLLAVAVGCGVAVAVLGATRPAAMAAACAVVLVVTSGLASGSGTLYQDRTFYGSYRVNEADKKRVFVHGTTVHGSQRVGEDSQEALSYYGPRGPVGELFEARSDLDSVGVVGLGVGTLASYLGQGQSISFFEIDPEVVRIAEDPELFTFLSSTQADVRHVVGDGRLSLQTEQAASYDLLVLDAFTSDAIPVHLLTEEAFDVYADRVAEDGVVLVHISNRMFDLEPVIAHAAENLGWHALVGEGATEGDELSSTWVALSPNESSLSSLGSHPDWRPVAEERVVWTDDFSSVLSVLDPR